MPGRRSRQGVRHVARLVQGVGVDGHLDAGLLGHAQQASIRPAWTPVLVQLERGDADAPCSRSASRPTVLPLPSSATFSGSESIARSIRATYQAPGVTVALGASAGPVPPAIRWSPRSRSPRAPASADQVYVAVDRAGGQDEPVAGDDLGARADHHSGSMRPWCPRAGPCPARRSGRRAPDVALTTPQWSSTARR